MSSSLSNREISVADIDAARLRLITLRNVVVALPKWDSIYQFKAALIQGDFAQDSINVFFEALSEAAVMLAASRDLFVESLAGWGLDDEMSVIGAMWDTILDITLEDAALAEGFRLFPTPIDSFREPRRREQKPRDTFSRPNRQPGRPGQTPSGDHEFEHKHVLRQLYWDGDYRWPVLPELRRTLGIVIEHLDIVIADPGWTGESADAAVKKLQVYRSDARKLLDKVVQFQDVIEQVNEFWQMAVDEHKNTRIGGASKGVTETPDGRASWRALVRFRDRHFPLRETLKADGPFNHYDLVGFAGLGGYRGEGAQDGPPVRIPPVPGTPGPPEIPDWDIDGAGGIGLAVDSSAGALGLFAGAGVGGVGLGGAGGVGGAGGAAAGGAAPGLGGGGMGIMGGGAAAGGGEDDGKPTHGLNLEAPELDEDGDGAPRSLAAGAGGRGVAAKVTEE